MRKLALLAALLAVPAVANATASTMTYSSSTNRWIATCPAASGVAACTLDCTNSPIAVTCSDTDTCAFTLSETHNYFDALVPGRTVGAFLENDECVVTNRGTNNITFATSSGVQELDATVTLGQWGSKRFVYSNARWTGKTSLGALTGDVTITGDLTVSGGDFIGVTTALDMGEATANTFTFSRTTSGTVNLTCVDDDATCAIALVPGGAAAATVGSASATAINLTTSTTGNAALVAPASSIGIGELTRPGHYTFQICGDAVTVSGVNTVFYGPSQVIVSSSTVGQRTCNTTAAGSATESAASAVALTATAFGVTSLVCTSDNPGVASGLTINFRANNAATTPVIGPCVIANGAAGSCVANVQTTVDVAPGQVVDVSVTSSQDVGTVHFICDVDVVF